MRVLILLAFLVGSAASATDVYRWVDANGQIHYSDQWRPGAEKIRIATESAVSGAAQAEQRATTGGTGQQSPAAARSQNRYESLEIARPAQEEVLWNIEGQLPVSVRVTPALQPGDSLRLYLDGNQQEMPAGSTDVQLQEVFRGAHTLKAQVVNEAGVVMIESPTTTFAVRQTSLLNPVRPNP
jgi:hypothetical protein